MTDIEPLSVESVNAITTAAHVWICHCGRQWDASDHARLLAPTGGRWRGGPYSLEPVKQWVRERLPNGKSGVVYCLDDGHLRCFQGGTGDLGMAVQLEWKSNGAELGRADKKTLHTIANGEALRPIVVRFDGDVPQALYHWPEPCPCCGAPGPLPRSSSWATVTIIGGRKRLTTGKYVTVTDHIVKLQPDALAGWLIRYVGYRL